MNESVIPSRLERTVSAAGTSPTNDAAQLQRRRGQAWEDLRLLGQLILPVVPPPSEPARLVVPVPTVEVDDGELARRIWAVVEAARLDVLLVARIDRPDFDLAIQRRLAQLVAMLRRRGRTVEASAEVGRTWLAVLVHTCRAGDIVVARGELGEGAARKAEDLATRLGIAVLRIDDLPVDLADRRTSLRPTILLTLAAPGAVLGVFAVLQTAIVRQAHGGLQPVLLASSVAAEMACLWLAEGQVNAWR